jgi:gluconate 5-dehydrogenase
MLASLFSLHGRVALVTGASRGLGLAMAQALAEAGATVAINGRDGAALEKIAGKLRDQGLRVEASCFDVRDQRASGAALEALLARNERLDILIANAGITHRGALGEWTPEMWNEVLATNLTACFFLAQRAAAAMRERRHGRIIFTSSITTLLGRAQIPGYVAAKSGLAGLMRSLAAELGADGVTCNAITPGYFETALTEPLLRDEAFAARITERIPLRRWGKPSDLAGAVVFLASDAATYVTGQQIVVDGGFSTTI